MNRKEPGIRVAAAGFSAVKTSLHAAAWEPRVPWKLDLLHLLGGSTHIRGQITPLITTHEPPSRVEGLQFGVRGFGLRPSRLARVPETAEVKFRM